jgi:predicted metal-dependent HD superfamily phosphohydrolase
MAQQRNGNEHVIGDVFLATISKFTLHSAGLWQEIKESYTAAGRYYHTLNHLDHFLNVLAPHRTEFADWDAVVFSIAYHDIIYKATKSNNEERSAEFAAKRLEKTSFAKDAIHICIKLILATKRHEASDHETNLFTDADLSVLGASEPDYMEYIRQIRKEYSIYPDFLYNPGRIKVLLHFLQMDRIFKSPVFFEMFEQQARANLQMEINLLK